MCKVDESVLEGLEPGSPCPHSGCSGTLDVAPIENCSCHVNPPCSACENSGLLCDECGWDSTPDRSDKSDHFDDLEDDMVRVRAARRGARRNETTHTRTANPFNSTPFTRCCGTAAINTDRCPNCEAKILWHDDGLAARRREVGPGNCLMCGKRRGHPSIAGNCHC